MEIMNSQELLNAGGRLKVKLNYSCNHSQSLTTLSPEYMMDQLGVFQLKLISVESNNGYNNIYYNYFFVRFKKMRPNDLIYTISFTSRELDIFNIKFNNDDNMWRLIGENNIQHHMFHISVRVEQHKNTHVCTFASLHEDTELTDFELRGTDGAVRVHRAVLAAASPVLRTMLSGAWRETAEGGVDVPDTTSATLQHLKDYLYLYTLPESGLEQLLLLACCYMMPDLQRDCGFKLLLTLTAENAYDMLEFATKHKVTPLVLDILEFVQKGLVSVNEMRCLLMPEVNKPE